MRAATNTSGDGTRILESGSPGETIRIARRLGDLLEGGEVLALRGDLGAGKTWFVKGLAESLGIAARDVTSPTFLVIHEIEGRLILRHIDAYRLSDAEELEEMGGGDLFGPDAVVAVEWAERAPAVLPRDHLDVLIESCGETSRRIVFRAAGPIHARLLDRLTGKGARP